MKTDPPAARPYGVSDREAVDLCLEWMKYLGESDAIVSEGQARDLCDLFSGRYLCWVDNRVGNLDQELVGKASALARSDGRRSLIFIAGGCAGDSQVLADRAGVAVLRYEPFNRTISAGNKVGRELIHAVETTDRTKLP